MTSSPLRDAHRQLADAVAALGAAVGSTATDDDLIAALTLCESTNRQLDRLCVSTIAGLQRRGSFTERGYRSPVEALSDLLGWERFEARRRIVAAEQVCPRIALDGTALPARLPATAEVFEIGQAGLRHVEVIARLLGSAAAARLTPAVWAAAEDELADKATVYTPAELQSYGRALIESLDVDGAEPDDREPTPVNELHLHRHGDRSGGTLQGRFSDAALFDTIVTLIDTHAKPLNAEDDRSATQRQAEALADICGYVLDHGDVPEAGGHRPHLNVIIGIDDLEQRARAATLDFGGTLTPEALRLLACDARVIPIVMNGQGQPLDVGRMTRTIPDGLRRAIAARDLGCAHPGCARPVSWCEIHHLQPWEEGGETSLQNCAMVCRVHHRLLHRESGWTVRIRDGLPEFLPPRWIDPERRPRRRPLPHLLAAACWAGRQRRPLLVE